jgi:hypothetical protein
VEFASSTCHPRPFTTRMRKTTATGAAGPEGGGDHELDIPADVEKASVTGLPSTSTGLAKARATVARSWAYFAALLVVALMAGAVAAGAAEPRSSLKERGRSTP